MWMDMHKAVSISADLLIEHGMLQKYCNDVGIWNTVKVVAHFQ